MTREAVISGVPWFDQNGEAVNAHGACVVTDGGRYYLFGEYKSNDENRFVGFSCYTSDDLVSWRFERLALPPQREGLLGPGRIGERPKVLRCPSTGRYVMLAHSDDLGYTNPVVTVAVSDTIDGEYTVLGPLTYRGDPLRRWDLGTFQDDDGAGYLLVHEGDIYRLADDYLSAAEKVAEGLAPGGESPAMLHADGTYALMFSHKTSWDRNDNYYLTSPRPEGPWTHRGLLAPEGTRTWNSQCTFVLRVERDGEPRWMYMGDRWSFPHQASAATYVWQPLVVDDGRVALPAYHEAWDPETFRPVPLEGPTVPLGLGSAVEVPDGGRLAVRGRSGQDGGYARLRVEGAGTVLEQLVDLYAPVRDVGLVYVSPPLAAGSYDVSVEALGEASVFFMKDGTRLGSTGTRVEIDSVTVL